MCKRNPSWFGPGEEMRSEEDGGEICDKCNSDVRCVPTPPAPALYRASSDRGMIRGAVNDMQPQTQDSVNMMLCDTSLGGCGYAAHLG